MCVENKLVDNWLNLNLSLAGLSWPLYIGGQVSRIWSGSIQITMMYTIWSRISIITMSGPNFYWAITRTCPRDTKITSLGSYTHVSDGPHKRNGRNLQSVAEWMHTTRAEQSFVILLTIRITVPCVRYLLTVLRCAHVEARPNFWHMIDLPFRKQSFTAHTQWFSVYHRGLKRPDL
jgi:hypothetical protein